MRNLFFRYSIFLGCGLSLFTSFAFSMSDEAFLKLQYGKGRTSYDQDVKNGLQPLKDPLASKDVLGRSIHSIGGIEAEEKRFAQIVLNTSEGMGGHTLSKHVAKGNFDSIQNGPKRLSNEPNLGKVSYYNTLDSAENDLIKQVTGKIPKGEIKGTSTEELDRNQKLYEHQYGNVTNSYMKTKNKNAPVVQTMYPKDINPTGNVILCHQKPSHIYGDVIGNEGSFGGNKQFISGVNQYSHGFNVTGNALQYNQISSNPYNYQSSRFSSGFDPTKDMIKFTGNAYRMDDPLQKSNHIGFDKSQNTQVKKGFQEDLGKIKEAMAKKK